MNEQEPRRTVPITIPYLLLTSLVSWCILIVAIVFGNIRTKKRKKPLASTFVYDNQLLSVKGEAQRHPWKDRDELPTNYIYSTDRYEFGSNLGDNIVPSNGISIFCNKISLTIKNEGILAIDTDVSKEPLGFNLDVSGNLGNIKVLDVEPANDRLDLSVREGMVLLNHVRLEPGKSFHLVF